MDLPVAIRFCWMSRSAVYSRSRFASRSTKFFLGDPAHVSLSVTPFLVCSKARILLCPRKLVSLFSAILSLSYRPRGNRNGRRDLHARPISLPCRHPSGPRRLRFERGACLGGAVVRVRERNRSRWGTKMLRIFNSPRVHLLAYLSMPALRTPHT